MYIFTQIEMTEYFQGFLYLVYTKFKSNICSSLCILWGYQRTINEKKNLRCNSKLFKIGRGKRTPRGPCTLLRHKTARDKTQLWIKMRKLWKYQVHRFFQIVQTARSHFAATKTAWKFKLQSIFLTGQMYKSLIMHVLKLYFLVLNKCPSNDVRLYLIYLFTR